jgi:hypothetical protein
MKHRVRLTNIVWETDGHVEPIATSMTVEVDTDVTNEEELFDRAIDKASDETGFCIVSAEASRTFAVVEKLNFTVTK